MMSSYIPLKNYFGKELAQQLSDLIKTVYPSFPSFQFIRAVELQVKPLELKARVRVVADELHRAIPLDYPEQIKILLQILGPENEREQGMFTEGYFLMPVAHFVERYGLEHRNRRSRTASAPGISLNVMGSNIFISQWMHFMKLQSVIHPNMRFGLIFCAIPMRVWTF